MKAQLPVSDWPLGLCEEALLLRLSPEEIAARTGILFEAAFDDLDEVDVAIVRYRDGAEVAFQRHRGAPIPGIVVIRRPGDDAALEWVVSELGLKSEDVIWSAPGVGVPGLRQEGRRPR